MDEAAASGAATAPTEATPPERPAGTAEGAAPAEG
jgi:hypothetical protein